MDGEDLQHRLQGAVEAMMDRLDKSKLRPMQKEGYLKMAACFDSSTSSKRQTDSCVEQSAHGMKQAQNLIQNEMNQFQNRLQRCTLQCQDEATDQMKFTSGGSNVEAEAQKVFLQCASKCVDKHIEFLQAIEQKLVKDLDQIASRKK